MAKSQRPCHDTCSLLVYNIYYILIIVLKLGPARRVDPGLGRSGAGTESG
jgi:hypothetical protein